MLLPQSSAFAALKNRLNSVSAIGYLHTVPRVAPATAAPSNFDRPNRLKGRDEGIRWTELLEKFRSVQEKARRAQRPGGEVDDGFAFPVGRTGEALDAKAFKDLVRLPGPLPPTKDVPATSTAAQAQAQAQKRSGLGKFGRLGGASRPKR